MSDKSQRTERPTAKHKKEVREKGTVARSPELGSWASLLVVAALLPWLGGAAASRVASFTRQVTVAVTHPTTATALEVLAAGLVTAAWAALPIVALCTVIGVAASFAQVGLRFTPKALRVQVSRISPGKGFARIFSTQGAWSLGKTLLKFGALALVGAVLMRGLLSSVLGGGTLPLADTLAAAGHLTEMLLRDIGVLALVIAAVDYGFQRRQYQRNLRMTKQEVRDELRRTEGSPEVLRARRSKARRLSKMRMMAAVAQADTVVVNPTHYAVALAYDRTKDRAPRVVAKGVDALAARIREKATLHGIPIVENPELARTLHAVCEVDDVVPATLYTAVARLLAFVYSLSPAAKALHPIHQMASLPPILAPSRAGG
ncbi:MAG TPA: EscU/YscU/HrcU family type III secretion system export apparatus switch protein [Acidimicrobiales bacterium]|nr:EscU/YscU/HrcU family type III secretion system export apparatus switch protein [Acidimicrobiales bacterium]